MINYFFLVFSKIISIKYDEYKCNCTYKRAEGEVVDRDHDDKDCKPLDRVQMLVVVELDDVRADTVENQSELVIPMLLLLLHCACYFRLVVQLYTLMVFPLYDVHALIVPEIIIIFTFYFFILIIENKLKHS